MINPGEFAYGAAPASSPRRGQVVQQKHRPVLLVLQDEADFCASLDPVCDFLGVEAERVSSHANLRLLLKELNPIGVVACTDNRGQDGFNVMMEVAEFDRTMPVLLFVENDAAVHGALDAVEAITQVSKLIRTQPSVSLGVLIDFVCQAERNKARRLDLLAA